MADGPLSYDMMLKPKSGDWVVLQKRGYITSPSCQFAVGLVRRVQGWKVNFHNTPLGVDVHGIETIRGIFPDEASARTACAKVRAAQDACRETHASAVEMFWQTFVDAGLSSKKDAHLASKSAQSGYGVKITLVHEGQSHG